MPNEDGTYTYVISPDRSRRRELDRLRRPQRRHPDAADGRVRRRRPDGGPRRARPGGEARRSGAEVPDAAAGERQERAAELADRRAAYLRRLPEGTICMAPLARHRLLHRHRSRDRPRRLEAGHTVVVTARRTETVADFADEFGDRAVVVAARRHRHATRSTPPSRPRTTRSAGSTCWSTTPATATCRRSRRVRTREVRKLFDTNYFGVGRHDQGGAARRCGPAGPGTSSTSRR